MARSHLVITRTPLRVSFVGGGSDLPSHYRKDFGCVVSTSIDKYVYVTIKTLSPLFPFKFKIGTTDVQTCASIDEIRNPIARETIRLSGCTDALDISVMSDVPAGTGLGSSSAFAVGLLHALDAYQGMAPTEGADLAYRAELAQRACQLEIDVLKEPIGKQDQYACAIGGLNRLTFNKDESVKVEPYGPGRAAARWLRERLKLYRLPGTRSASQVLKSYRSQDGCLQLMASLALFSEIDALGKDIAQGWAYKQRLTPGAHTPEVQAAVSAAESQGGSAKLLGAGGTGFVLTYGKQVKLDLPEMAFNMDTKGTKLLYSSYDELR